MADYHPRVQRIRHGDRFTLIGGPQRDLRQGFQEDVRAGLCAPRKELSCRYLYDQRGSELFERICEQPEYYLTRVEAALLRRIAPELARSFSHAPRLVELGSGSAEKTRYLIEALIAEHGSLVFDPIDISRSALEAGCQGLLGEFPTLEVRAVAAEYVPGLQLLAEKADTLEAPRLVAWLGSSIGNFHRPDAAAFLAELAGELRVGESLLVGVDMRKQQAVLEAAYDDAAGVTADFIKNLLVRINSELGGNFDTSGFRYRAHYAVEEGRVEMWLISDRACRVEINDLELDLEFAEGEAIHIENSYKYSPEEILTLAQEAGMDVLEQWSDDEDRFRELWLAPRPSSTAALR